MQQQFAGMIFALKNCTKHLLRLTETFSLTIYISASLMLTQGSYSLTLILKASLIRGGYKDQQNDWINAGQFWRSRSKSFQNWVLKIIGLNAC